MTMEGIAYHTNAGSNLYPDFDTSQYLDLSAFASTDCVILPADLNGLKIELKIAEYRNRGYPFGKSKRGLKKWMKQY